jgi:hypothetical protein
MRATYDPNEQRLSYEGGPRDRLASSRRLALPGPRGRNQHCHTAAAGSPHAAGERSYEDWSSRSTAAMVLSYDPETQEAVICSGGRTPTGSATFASVRRCKFRLGGSRSPRSNASSLPPRDLRWRSTSDAGIRGGCASSRKVLGWTISALTLP